PLQSHGYINAIRSSVISANILQRMTVKLSMMYMQQFVFLTSVIALLVIMCAYDVWSARSFLRREGSWSRWLSLTHAPVALLVVGATVGLVINDHENTPLMAVVIFLMFHTALMAYTPRTRFGEVHGWGRVKYVVTLLPFLIFSTWHLCNDAICFAIYAPRVWTTKVTPLDSSAPGIRRLTLQFPMGPHITLPDHLNDGLRLLRGYHEEHALILQDDFSNPFPYLLQTPPPKGTLAWMDPSRTFSIKDHPKEEDMFGNVEVILAWTAPGGLDFSPTTAAFRHIYGQYVVDHYDQMGFDHGWILMRKKGRAIIVPPGTSQTITPPLPDNFNPIGRGPDAH
ncbi:MAG: hypothetical protein ACRYGR_08530, partial [Janthinobacterium lividum]